MQIAIVPGRSPSGAAGGARRSSDDDLAQRRLVALAVRQQRARVASSIGPGCSRAGIGTVPQKPLQ